MYIGNRFVLVNGFFLLFGGKFSFKAKEISSTTTKWWLLDKDDPWKILSFLFFANGQCE